MQQCCNKYFMNLLKNKKILFYEIPLLIESKLMKFFDLVIFIKAKKEIRKKRFKARGGEERLFNILNTKQYKNKFEKNLYKKTILF